MSESKQGKSMLFKVVKIISEYDVVINAGSDDGVKVGDIFEIYEPGDVVNDPDTDEVLGTLDFVKARIQVKTVFQKMSLCTNTETSTSTIAELALSMSSFYASSIKPLNVDALDISGGFEDVNKKIRVSDLVRKALV